MKPTLILCMALMCLTVVLSAPAPAPTLLVSTAGTLVAPTLVLGTGTTSLGTGLAVAGLAKLKAAALLALAAQN